jgi:alkanesulfonate monooxygenase SsuD/methylene tetrahydromethanopterin reductase-like flavin-dependent oxidoreductase (luciferase family)
MARKLEAACFDYVLLEDSSAIPNEYAGSRAVYLSETVHAPKFDPVVVATFMAAATSKLGIIPTLTTTFYPPFILARMTQTFDLLTRSRRLEHRHLVERPCRAEFRSAVPTRTRRSV